MESKKNHYYYQAVALRRQGLSYNEIRKNVPVAKSTLSLWLKAIRLPAKHRKRLYTKQIAFLSLGASSQKARRQKQISKILEEAKREVTFPISESIFTLMGAGIYWAEGTKRKSFGVTNSDPLLILFMVRWFKEVFDIHTKDLKVWLNIYPQQNERDIKNFWSELTGIPLKNFGKSYIKPRSKDYKRNNLYYGTIKVVVPKGTDSIHRVSGWIEAVMQDRIPKLQNVQMRWEVLQKTPRPINLGRIK